MNDSDVLSTTMRELDGSLFASLSDQLHSEVLAFIVWHEESGSFGLIARNEFPAPFAEAIVRCLNSDFARDIVTDWLAEH